MPGPQSSPVERALRGSARFALWASLAVTALAALGLSRLARPAAFLAEMAEIEADQRLWQDVDFETLPEVRLLQQYVRIDTSHPNPDEVAGAEFLAARLEAMGVHATIERFGDRRANLWALVEGDDPRALVLHSHIDVEPASEQEGWRYPPFGGVVEGPWIYGRGMYDMKSLAVAQLAAVEGVVAEQHATGHRPRRSLLLLATSSEETGSETGTRWILERHPELVGRMAAVWTEGGVVEARSAREVKYWGIEFAQKRFGRVDFCSSDRARLERLRTLLNEDHAARPRLPIDPGVEAFLERYAKTRGLGLYRKLLAEPEEVVTRPERFRQLTPFLRSLFREEMAAAPIRQDPDGTYRLTVALHLFASSDVDAVLAELLPEWKTFGTSVTELRMASPGAISRLDHWAFTEAAEAVRRAHPEAEVGPYFLPWTGTDARYFRAAGIPTYGFSPFLISVTDTLQIGRANERMQLPGFVRGIELYRDAVRRALR